MIATPTPLGELEQLLALPMPAAGTTQRRVNQNTPIVTLRLAPEASEITQVAEIRLPTSSSSSSSGDGGSSAAAALGQPLSSRVCGACHRQVSKYTCPRCNVSSCSLACYRSHSDSCTRDFAAASLQQEQHIDLALKVGLGRTRAVLGQEYQQAKQTRQNTVAMLGRLAEFNERNDGAASDALMPAGSSFAGRSQDDDEDDSELSEEQQQTEDRLLAALSLLDRLESKSGSGPSAESISNADLLALQGLLPPAVLKDFHRSIADGRMASWIARWQAWWRPDVGLEMDTAAAAAAQPEQELTPSTWSLPSVRIMMADAEDLPATAPPMPVNVPSFSSLFNGTPSSMLPLHVAELLYSYAYALLLHNGEEAEAAALVGVMCELSPVLRGDVVAPPPEATSAAASAAASASPARAVPSFAPTADLVHSLHSMSASLLGTTSISSGLTTSCCWSLARLGDTSQLLHEKDFVLRALGHVQSLVERAALARKQAKLEQTKSADSAPLAPKLPFAAMSRKLLFLQAFVRDVWQEADLRAWNQCLYAHWADQWETHVEMHREKAQLQQAAATTAAR